MASLGDFLFGSSNKLKQFSQFSPEQQNFFQQLFGQLGEGGQLGAGYGQAMQGLQEWLDPSSQAYQNFAEPYMRQFEQETVPGLAERFAGAGALGGGLSSSGFGQALSSAGGNLQSNLASMKSQLQRQAMGDIMGQYNQLAQMGMGAQPFGYYEQPGSMGMLPMMGAGWAAGGFPGAGKLYNSIFGGQQQSGGRGMGGSAGGWR